MTETDIFLLLLVCIFLLCSQTFSYQKLVLEKSGFRFSFALACVIPMDFVFLCLSYGLVNFLANFELSRFKNSNTQMLAPLSNSIMYWVLHIALMVIVISLTCFTSFLFFKIVKTKPYKNMIRNSFIAGVLYSFGVLIFTLFLSFLGNIGFLF